MRAFVRVFEQGLKNYESRMASRKGEEND